MDEIKKAAALLAQDELVAMPTETVYGLAGNALSDIAVARIYEAKGRPQFNPLIVHVRSPEEAKKYAAFNETAQRLAVRFWPGPLTLVLPRLPDCPLSLLVSAGLDTVAIRVPAHPLARALLKECRLPLAAPSANRSGKVSPTLAAHVKEDLGERVAMVLDGDACKLGIESTVVDATGDEPVMLRPGAVTQEQLQAVIKNIVQPDKNFPIKSPGMLERHYAPAHPLRLNAAQLKEGEALLAFATPLAGAAHMQNLSAGGDLQEAAANLFRMLRALDKTGCEAIAVMPVPEEGLGVAINDRLRRAAAR